MRVAFHTSCNEKYLPGLKVLIKGIRKNEKLYDPLMTEEETGRSELVSDFIIIK